MKNVTVTADKNGVVLFDTKNPDYKSIRVEGIVEGGFSNGIEQADKKRSTFLRILTANAAKYPAGKVILGQIIAVESILPAYEGQTPKMNKSAEEGGVVLVDGFGNPIYRNSVFTQDLSATDVIISHANQLKAVSTSASMNA